MHNTKKLEKTGHHRELIGVSPCEFRHLDVTFSEVGCLQVFVFDFGSEMYLWTGKHVPFDRRKRSLRLAVELWDAGYDFTGYDINPLCPLICTNKLMRL